jgi:hypothetical protein
MNASIRPGSAGVKHDLSGAGKKIGIDSGARDWSWDELPAALDWTVKLGWFPSRHTA